MHDYHAFVHGINFKEFLYKLNRGDIYNVFLHNELWIVCYFRTIHISLYACIAHIIEYFF